MNPKVVEIGLRLLIVVLQAAYSIYLIHKAGSGGMKDIW